MLPVNSGEAVVGIVDDKNNWKQTFRFPKYVALVETRKLGHSCEKDAFENFIWSI